VDTLTVSYIKGEREEGSEGSLKVLGKTWKQIKIFSLIKTLFFV
jgi:hypothetical protein